MNETFKEYSENAAMTAKYPNSQCVGGLSYVLLGLTGEVGEVANKAKKLIRDSALKESDPLIFAEVDKIRALKDEAADCLWYLDRLAHELGTTLQELADMNIKKLHSRLDRGAIGGAGDQR